MLSTKGCLPAVCLCSALQCKVLLDLTTVTWYKSKLTQAIFVALLLAFGLFVGTWVDTSGPTRGTTAAAFAAFSGLLMVVLKQKTITAREDIGASQLCHAGKMHDVKTDGQTYPWTCGSFNVC